MNRRNYLGWIVVEEEPGYRASICVEWVEDGERRRRAMNTKGNSGCAEAIEWWDAKAGEPIALEKFPIGYRVFRASEASNG